MILKNNNINSSLPIGIIDSGVGGLTIAKYLKSIIPNEQIIYFGDTKNMPYGNKDKNMIQYYSLKIINFLIQQKCKAIVIACNSIASNSLQVIRQNLPQNVILFDVISPIIQTYSFINIKKLGIIATEATINSNIFFSIKNKNPNIEIIPIAIPLLATMIEKKSSKKNIINYLKDYLGNKKLKNIDSLLLACTHYYIIKNEIFDYYNNKIQLIDSRKLLVTQIYHELNKFELLSKVTIKKDIFYVSMLTNNFIEKINIFFKEKNIILVNSFDQQK